MQLRKVQIKNFRLLQDIELNFEERTTLVVGRNNSGKTSLAELFRRLFEDNSPSFRMEDFSLSIHDRFWDAFLLYQQKREENEIREMLPVIETWLTIGYEDNAATLGALSNFIVDLNPDCFETRIGMCYQLRDGEIINLFKDIDYNAEDNLETQKRAFCREIKERLNKFYSCRIYAEDPGDPDNRREMEWTQLRALLRCGFIFAQRGLDDTTHKEINLLGKILEDLLSSAQSELAGMQDKDIVQNLKSAVEKVQTEIDQGFNQHLQELIPTFKLFGYPGLTDPKLLTETVLDVKRLLKDHTKIQYAGSNGINLPEAYNGLGMRNLIFILLKLWGFFKSYLVDKASAGIQLIFIEEPEVHLHPQMQEVFISQLDAIVAAFLAEYNIKDPWPVQFIVSTHSSHIANKAPFEAMRYFLAATQDDTTLQATRIKDLKNGFKAEGEDSLRVDYEFLHKYMTLTRCDLLFADKAVLIEGPTERILFPRMIEKTDASLSSQYIAVIEIGGAYAHKFFKLLEFLELPTLIITDLDCTVANEHGHMVACTFSESTGSSNACLKEWFNENGAGPKEFIQKEPDRKIDGSRRLAFQLPETAQSPCGRSFEDAFMLANADLFNIAGSCIGENEKLAMEKAAKVKKTDFALEYAIEKNSWVVPRYIAEGLIWLAQASRQQIAETGVAHRIAQGENGV